MVLLKKFVSVYRFLLKENFQYSKYLRVFTDYILIFEYAKMKQIDIEFISTM